MKSVIRLFAATMLTFTAVATEPSDGAVDQWRAYRVGIFIHRGPSSGLGFAESHSKSPSCPSSVRCRSRGFSAQPGPPPAPRAISRAPA
jgi:hypothetical protein